VFRQTYGGDAVRTCAAAALDNLSTAAELGSVELIFMNAAGRWA